MRYSKEAHHDITLTTLPAVQKHHAAIRILSGHQGAPSLQFQPDLIGLQTPAQTALATHQQNGNANVLHVSGTSLCVTEKNFKCCWEINKSTTSMNLNKI